MDFDTYSPRPFAEQLHNRNKRWVTLVCHRRAGKTVSCCMELILGALETKKQNPQFAYLAPFREQGKRIAWQYLKDLSRKYWSRKPNESDLILYMKSRGGEARVFVGGADNPDALRGLYFDGVVLDEVGDIRPTVWYSVLRPALADRKGWAVFAGTPKGKNMFWALREEARINPKTHLLLEVKASESGLLDPDELRDARAQMTEDAYLREFECSFDASIPGAYWAKDIEQLYTLGRVKELTPDPDLPVEVVGDLGFTDSCSWWVWQTAPDGYAVVDFYEADSQPVQHYIDWIKGLPYKVDKVWLPHDAKAKSLQTGRSIIETFLSNGIRPNLVPELSVQDGIEAARKVIPFCYFNEEATYRGVEHLRAYCREWDERNQVFKQKPKHDLHSHASDAFRYLSLAARKFSHTMKVAGGEQGAQAVQQAIDKQTYGFSLEDLYENRPTPSRRIS